MAACVGNMLSSHGCMVLLLVELLAENNPTLKTVEHIVCMMVCDGYGIST